MICSPMLTIPPGHQCSQILTNATQEKFSRSSPTSPAQCLSSIACNSTKASEKEEGGVYCASSTEILCCLDPESCQKDDTISTPPISSAARCLAQPTHAKFGLDIKQNLPCKWVVLIFVQFSHLKIIYLIQSSGHSAPVIMILKYHKPTPIYWCSTSSCVILQSFGLIPCNIEIIWAHKWNNKYCFQW